MDLFCVWPSLSKVYLKLDLQQAFDKITASTYLNISKKLKRHLS